MSINPVTLKAELTRLSDEELTVMWTYVRIEKERRLMVSLERYQQRHHPTEQPKPNETTN
jgi:hypothetical protein